MIDQVNSITGNVIGTTQVFPQFEKGRFFIVAHDTSRQSEFDVFDKNNLEKSLYTITLPQTTTGKYITWAPQKLLFFDKSDSLYMIAYFQSKNSGVLGDPEYIVFKVSFTGSVVPLASLGKGIPLGDEIIDRDAGMIAWHDTSIIKVFDIATKEYHKLSYTAPKENLIVSRILSYRDNIITFLVDRTEVSGITPQAIVVTADMTLQKTISTIPYTTYHIPSKIIEYQDCDMGGACSLFSVNGGKVRHYTGGIYFTDLINNGQLLFGWYDGNV